MAAEIIPVASGKGGVGKTLMVAALGHALVRLGSRVIVVDLDIGASNLPVYMGHSIGTPGIGAFLEAGDKTALSTYVQPTSQAGLGLLSGDSAHALLANMAFTRKVKLLRHLSKLTADIVLLDLSAGASYNTLDFFASGANGLLVSTPDYPAMINCMSFLKNFYLRLTFQRVRRNRPAYARFKALQSASPSMPLKVLWRELDAVGGQLGESARAVAGRFHPQFVMNRVESDADLSALDAMQAGLKERLSMTVQPIGSVPDLQAVRDHVRTEPAAAPVAGELQAAILPLAESIMRGHEFRDAARYRAG